MRDFKKLKVWEKAHKLTLSVYKMTKEFPKDEQYGLVSQLRRSAASIPANIAEGYARSGKAERCNFFNFALASACETEYQLLLSKDLGYITNEEYIQSQSALEEIQKMLSGLYNRIKNEG